MLQLLIINFYYPQKAIIMKYLLNTVTKQFTILLLIPAIATTHAIKSMDNKPVENRLNNCVTVENKNNDPQSLIQLNYQKVDLPNRKFIGRNKLLNALTKTKCHIASMHGDGHSSLTISASNIDDDTILTNTSKYSDNPSSSLRISDPSIKRTLKVPAHHDDIITIHSKDDQNRILITKNGEKVGSFYY
jgi:hypothetical protein